VEHVGAADIYITPYQQEAQVVSGTLAIALGAGKAIISTPYWHAKELLAEKRGVIVPFGRPDAIAEAVVALLENDAERHAMRKRAYLHSRGTTWPKTAHAYMASFQRARFERSLQPRPAQQLDEQWGCWIELTAAYSRYRPFVSHDGRHRHLAARDLLGAEHARGLYNR
jgi:hypothetical protein